MNHVSAFFTILLATLREIFDENAYQRFLVRTGSPHSTRSYQEFMRERETQMSQKPRCC
jgi:hypothetical protein